MLFLKALSVFLGTVIGVGMFGLPFVALKAGFLITALYFLFMCFIVILAHYLYGEVVLNTKEKHRLPGYAQKYLGEAWKKFAFVVMIIGLTGALLAYLVIGGQFLNALFSSYLGGSPVLYTFIFFAFGAYLVFRGIKSISEVELSLLIVLFIILTVFLIKAFPFINVEYFKEVNLKHLTFPYGVILFSLWGSTMVPEIKEMFALKTREVRKDLKRVIFWGVLIAAAVYLSFIFIVLGVSGPNTSEEAMSGFSQAVGGNIIKLGFLFGVISCFTSFITVALALKKIFWYDFGFSKDLAWVLTCFLPLILFLLGLREFIGIISFTGAIALGFEGIIIIFLYKEFLKKKFSRKMNPGLYLLFAVFILGIVFEVIYFF